MAFQPPAPGAPLGGDAEESEIVGVRIPDGIPALLLIEDLVEEHDLGGFAVTLAAESRSQ